MKSNMKLPGFLIDIGNNGIDNSLRTVKAKGTTTQTDIIVAQASPGPLPSRRNQMNFNSRVMSPAMNYSCQGMLCSCSGDDDCNDMFTSGGCGDIAQCDERGCWCLRF